MLRKQKIKKNPLIIGKPLLDQAMVQDSQDLPKFCEKSSLEFIYDFTCLSMAIDPTLGSKLQKYHEGVSILFKEDLFGYIIELCNQFKHFALCLKEFLTLTKDDQRRLLYQNTPIYVQLILGLYFNARTGLEQLQSLPGMDYCGLKMDSHKIDLFTLNIQLGLFHPNCSLELYSKALSHSCFQVKL